MGARIRITGLIERAVTLDEETLAGLTSVVDDVSSITEGAVGSAVPVRDIIERVKPLDDATHCTVISRDEAYRASIPIIDLFDGGRLAFALDGDVLPVDRGGPLRLTAARGATLCWNVKDVGELHFAPEREPDDVPETPPH